MTVIAWDGKTLAADKLSARGGTGYTITKIRRIDNLLVGASGGSDYCAQMLAWIEGGRDIAKFPADQNTKDDFACVVAVTDGGRVLTYDRTPYPVHIESMPFAIGCGRDCALGAMAAGATAAEAVEITGRFDINCGRGVDMLELA